MRDLGRALASGAALLLTLVLASVGLWVGVPLAWLYIGSQVQAATGSLGAALGAMAVGVLATIVAIVWLLGWLSRKRADLREARGLESRADVALEGVMAVSAVVALAGFVVWFFLFSGSSPVPVLGGGE